MVGPAAANIAPSKEFPRIVTTHKEKHGSEIEIEEAKEKKDKSCGYVLGFFT